MAEDPIDLKRIMENFLSWSVLDFTQEHRRLPTLIRVPPDVWDGLCGGKKVRADVKKTFNGIHILLDEYHCEEGTCNVGDTH